MTTSLSVAQATAPDPEWACVQEVCDWSSTVGTPSSSFQAYSESSRVGAQHGPGTLSLLTMATTRGQALGTLLPTLLLGLTGKSWVLAKDTLRAGREALGNP